MVIEVQLIVFITPMSVSLYLISILFLESVNFKIHLFNPFDFKTRLLKITEIQYTFELLVKL